MDWKDFSFCWVGRVVLRGSEFDNVSDKRSGFLFSSVAHLLLAVISKNKGLETKKPQLIFDCGFFKIVTT